MDIVYWSLIIIAFIISFVGVVYPIIPSVLFIAVGFILYGVFYTFGEFSILFWIIQGLLIVALFAADYVANLMGVKKFGGTKAGIWGSTIGLLVGPFVIPVLGIIIGPFIGAVLGELLVHKTSFQQALKIGFGSLVGFFSGAITKGVIQLFMIGYFLYAVL
ncbi:DUF456 domain-containing protein [Bacillus sp. CGMCC 1.16541]|uniref:DUF456 domain-containing protein n=1 Tax=Bacillus sp. CGMCC 1.16541 TaxID=2185143 RepID=UPI000D732DD2|nr:DUF456 domain-containing protein [Bacillus sp. CGMCC 1.16541]